MKKLQTKKDNQVFSRFEIKYILKKKISNLIQEEIKNFIIYDEFSNNNYQNKYFVRSLYFDDDSFQNFNDKIDGIKNRHKFRIRTYSQDLNYESKFFLELKGRNNERTYKIRTKIENNDLDFFFKKNIIFDLKKKYLENTLVEKFIFESFKKKLQPKVLIDYFRKPFINKTGPYFRLTFDSNLKACSANNIFDKKNIWKSCIAGYDILELKFDWTIPPWFHKIIQSFELKRLSVSKFVLGCEASDLAYDFEGR